MWRLAALAILLCAGCEKTEFYQADTHTWFATPPASAPIGVESAAKP